MKSKLLIAIGIFAIVGFKNHPTHSQFEPNDIIGTYWNQEKDAKIRIFLAQNGKYSGKIEWMKYPNDENGNPKKDPKNPNPKLRDRARLGMVILKYFEYDKSDKRWENGTVYDPKSGKTYSGYIRFSGTNTDKLFLRGYVMGMTWLGRTAEWERVK